jgi:hypothetical protein
MKIYTVHAPPAFGDAPPNPVGYVFVKEGFCWPALFVPELWLIFRRMWLIFLLYLLLALVVYAFDRAEDASMAATFMLLARLLLAVEGNSLRRWTLGGRGFSFVGVAAGKNVEEAELRYFFEAENPRPHPGAAPMGRIDGALRRRATDRPEDDAAIAAARAAGAQGGPA